MDSDLNLLQSIFPGVFISKYNNGPDNYSLGETKRVYGSPEYPIKFTIPKNGYNECYIEYLSASLGLSGTEVLRRIELFCLTKSVKITVVSLQDASSIQWSGYNFSLAHINIMKKGISWYNERGYFQRDFTSNVAHWENLKSLNFVQVLKEHESKTPQQLKRSYFFDTRIDSYSKSKPISEFLIELQSYRNFEDDTFEEVGSLLNGIFRKELDETESDESLNLINCTLCLYVLCLSMMKYSSDSLIKNLE